MNQGIKYRKLEEITRRLRKIADTPEAGLGDDSYLIQAISALVPISSDLATVANRSEILSLADRLEGIGAKKADPILEGLAEQLSDEESEQEMDFSSKAINPELLKQLVAELDEHRALTDKGLDKEVIRLVKISGLENYRDQIKKAMAREVEIYRSNLKKTEGENSNLSSQEKERQARMAAEAQAVLEQRFAAEGNTKIEAAGKAEKIIEAVFWGQKEEGITEAGINEVLRREESKESGLPQAVSEDIKDIKAKIEVKRKAEEIAKKLVDDIRDSNTEALQTLIDNKRIKLEEEIAGRIEEVMAGTKEEISYREEVRDEKGILYPGDDFTTKIANILVLPDQEPTGRRAVQKGPEPNTAGIDIKIESETLRQIELEIRQYEENNLPTVDRYRGSEAEKIAVFEVLNQNSGLETEKALEYARVIRQINYGPDGVSLTPEEQIAALNAEEMYEVDHWRVKQAKQEFRVIQKLVSSDKPVGQQADEFAAKFGNLKLSEDSQNETGATNRIMNLIRRRGDVRGVLEGVQQIVKVRISSPEWMKKAWAKSGLETGAREVVKAGGRWIEKAAGVSAREFVTQGIGNIAKYGLHDGVMELGKQLLTKSMKPIMARAAQTAAGKALLATGAKAAAALGVSSTGVGAVVIAALAAVQVAWGRIKKATQQIKGGIDKIMARVFGSDWQAKAAKLNFLAPLVRDIKSWIPGVTDKIPEWILTGGGIFFGIISMLLVVPIAATVGTAAAGTIAGLFAYNIFFIHPIISELVPPAPPKGVEVEDYSGAGAPTAVPFDPNNPWAGNPMPTRDPKIPISPSCPEIWPTNSGYVTQGPNGSWSHRGVQAIDIGVGSVAIHATHGGLARAGWSTAGYGYYVIVDGICNGVKFSTLYAHQPKLPFSGQKTVKQGDQIGVVDNTGNSTGSHLHYELRGLGEINKWVPKPVPNGCSNVSQCGTKIP